MVEYLKLLGLDFENRKNILFLLKDKNGKEINRNYKDAFWPFELDDGSKLIVDTLGREKFRFITSDGDNLLYSDLVDKDNRTIQYEFISKLDNLDDLVKLNLTLFKDDSNFTNICRINGSLSLMGDSSSYYNFSINNNPINSNIVINNKVYKEFDGDIPIDEIIKLISKLFYLSSVNNFSNYYSILKDHIFSNVSDYLIDFEKNKDSYVTYLLDEYERVSLEKEKELSIIYKKYDDVLSSLDSRIYELVFKKES